MIKADVSGYLESWSNELKARQDRVRLLIGDAHWLSDGHHKEAIVREFLLRYLPNYLVISRGFVRPPRVADACSPEVDILVCDPTLHPPFFNEGGLVIAPPSSTIAHFQVKTKFNRTTLLDALKSIARTQVAVSSAADANKVWRCVCFFESDMSSPSEVIAARVAEDLYATAAPTSGKQPNIGGVNSSLLPTCIVVMSKFLGFIVRDDSADRVVLRWFDAGEISLACGLADMFAAITLNISGSSVGELDQMIESFNVGSPTVVQVVETNGGGKK